MIRKIFHTADIHIRNLKFHKEYRIQFDKFLASVKEEMGDLQHHEARIAIVGDLVHQKITISNEMMVLASYLLNECSKICPVVLVAGNHDLLEHNPDRVDSITPIVDMINNSNIHYYKETNCILDENIVWCNYSIFGGNQRPDIDEARNLYGDDKTYLGLFHGPILGSVTDIGYEFDHGANLEHFGGCSGVLCGDIHKRQKFILNDDGKNVPVVMPSSLIQQNYGETVKNHGYTVWELDTLNDKHVEIPNEYSFYTFNVKSLDELDDESYKLTNG